MIHRHKWDIVAVHPLRIEDISFSYHHPSVSYKTRVLRVCSICGNSKVKELKGTWSLEEVKGGK